MRARIARSLIAVALAVASLALAGCGGFVAYHPGYVYYDSYGYPYTYVAYSGGYRVAYVHPGAVVYRGGVQVVSPGYSGYYYQRPSWGVHVEPPRGGVVVNSAPGYGGVHVHGRGAVEVNGR